MAIPFAAMAGMGGAGGFSSMAGGRGMASLFGGGSGGAASIWPQLEALLGKSAAPQTGGPSDVQAASGKLSSHQNLTQKVNDAFNSLRAFGESLRGADKTPLNNIPRNAPQVILPANNQNPGSMNLQQLMAMIAAGGLR